MTRKLEDITVDEFWTFYRTNYPPPPDCPPDDIEAARNFYLSGLAAMLAFARRLDVEPPERRATILDKLHRELAGFAHAGQQLN